MHAFTKISALIVAVLLSVHVYASGNKAHKPNKTNPVAETAASSQFKLLDIFVYKPQVATKPDTTFRARIKPDFSGLKMPKNTLWLHQREEL